MTTTKTRLMCLTALCAALMAVLSPWAIMIGPVGLTLGVFSVFFAGAMLPPGWAATACGVYLFLGAVGLPVFSGMTGGPQVLVGMTGGYLWTYPLMAALVAAACARSQKRWVRLCAVGLAILICYVLGTAWFMYVTGMNLMESLISCVFPFILPDFLKGVFALLLAGSLQKRMKLAR